MVDQSQVSSLQLQPENRCTNLAWRPVLIRIRTQYPPSSDSHLETERRHPRPLSGC